MSDQTLFSRIVDWLAMRPIYLAYRLVWLAAKTGHADAKAVHQAMWDAHLAIPPLTAAQRLENDA